MLVSKNRQRKKPLIRLPQQQIEQASLRRSRTRRKPQESAKNRNVRPALGQNSKNSSKFTATGRSTRIHTNRVPIPYSGLR